MDIYDTYSLVTSLRIHLDSIRFGLLYELYFIPDLRESISSVDMSLALNRSETTITMVSKHYNNLEIVISCMNNVSLQHFANNLFEFQIIRFFFIIIEKKFSSCRT